MLDYQPAKSPYYERNKDYCEQVTEELNELKFDYSGFCNSYGYDIHVDFTHNSLNYNLNFHKHQSTMQGGWYPRDAVNYSDIIIKITGLKDQVKLTLLGSRFKAFFLMRKNKYTLRNGQLIKSTLELNHSQLEGLNQFAENNTLSRFRIRNGKVYCRLNSRMKSTQETLKIIEQIILKWA